MKKHLSLIIACLLIAACALTACGTPEENFKKATQNFDNFTLDIETESGGKKDSAVIIKADNILKMVSCSQFSSTTIYVKREGEKYRVYDFTSKNWSSEYSKNDVFGSDKDYYESGVIGVLKQSFFDDYTVSNDEYTMKESALNSYSKYFNGNLKSFRFKLSGDHFEQAIAIEEANGERTQYTYKFKDFGSSKIDIE